MKLLSKFKKTKLTSSREDQNNLPVDQQLIISKAQTAGWKRMTKLLGIALALQLMFSAVNYQKTSDVIYKIRTTQTGNSKVLEGVQSLLKFVADSTSDAAQTARTQGTQAIILEITCSQRQVAQELVNGFVKQGVLRANSVSLITPECKGTK